MLFRLHDAWQISMTILWCLWYSLRYLLLLSFQYYPFACFSSFFLNGRPGRLSWLFSLSSVPPLLWGRALFPSSHLWVEGEWVWLRRGLDLSPSLGRASPPPPPFWRLGEGRGGVWSALLLSPPLFFKKKVRKIYCKVKVMNFFVINTLLAFVIWCHVKHDLNGKTEKGLAIFRHVGRKNKVDEEIMTIIK